MTTKLSNGEEMMLVEVPEDADRFEIYGVPGKRKHLRYGGEKLKMWGKWNRNINTQNILAEKDEAKILGTYFKGEIDFEPKVEWVESSREFNSQEPYLHQYKDYINEIDFDLDLYGSFISLLKSQSQPDKKYVVLIKKR